MRASTGSCRSIISATTVSSTAIRSTAHPPITASSATSPNTSRTRPPGISSGNRWYMAARTISTSRSCRISWITTTSRITTQSLPRAAPSRGAAARCSTLTRTPRSASPCWSPTTASSSIRPDQKSRWARSDASSPRIRTATGSRATSGGARMTSGIFPPRTAALCSSLARRIITGTVCRWSSTATTTSAWATTRASSP